MLCDSDVVNQYKHVSLMYLQLFGSGKLYSCAAVPDCKMAYVTTVHVF